MTFADINIFDHFSKWLKKFVHSWQAYHCSNRSESHTNC